MEMQLNVEFHQYKLMFKIDLIVWKFGIDEEFEIIGQLFKIDLIVWKLKTASSTPPDGQRLK